MTVRIEPILLEQKSVLVQLMELFNYDFSIYSGDDLNEYGYYGYDHIDDYWNEEGRFPYFIRVDDKLAGFVLVRSCCEYNTMENPHNIAEFFVLQKYRRQGVGKQAAKMIFDLHRGGWEVTQWASNVPAQKFWRAVINEYTGGAFDAFGSLEEGHVGFTFYNG
ncbi:MAG: GNAT family N-acetyltransferase [Clostridiales bacterium]|nr:GNAT family N-acetyltransferase [Clostridiales bacterium]